MNKILFESYVRNTLASAALLLFLVITFNRLIDPLGLYDGPYFDGINTFKLYINGHTRLSKANAIKFRKPKGIILGSSRSERGLDPLHPGWGEGKVFNLSLPGGSIYEALRYFQHAHTIQPLKQVVLALGLRQFKYSEQVNHDFSEERLAVSIDGQTDVTYLLQEWMSIYVSMEAFEMSKHTFLSQNETPHYLSHGEYNPKRLIENVKEHRKFFINSEKGYCDSTYRNFSFFDSEGEESTFSHYRQLLGIAYRDSIDLKLIISPVHARQLETISICGERLWGKWENWKRQLISINENEAYRAGKTPFSLLDFSGYNMYTVEEVPSLKDNITRMKWFWDSSHFKKELGDIVLDKVFNYHIQNRKVTPNFGVLLSSENIESHLQEIRIERKLWRESFPKYIQEIEKMKKQ